MIAICLWALNIHFALTLGIIAALTNFVPYIGQMVGRALPTVVALGQTGSIGQSLVVAGMYLAVLGIEEYIITPMVMGRSLDLNGTTILIACLFWGYLWGLVGLVLAMPITVSMKVVFQTIPELNRWAELMSLDWQSPMFAMARESTPCCRANRRLPPNPDRRERISSPPTSVKQHGRPRPFRPCRPMGVSLHLSHRRPTAW